MLVKPLPECFLKGNYCKMSYWKIVRRLRVFKKDQDTDIRQQKVRILSILFFYWSKKFYRIFIRIKKKVWSGLGINGSTLRIFNFQLCKWNLPCRNIQYDLSNNQNMFSSEHRKVFTPDSDLKLQYVHYLF